MVSAEIRSERRKQRQGLQAAWKFSHQGSPGQRWQRTWGCPGIIIVLGFCPLPAKVCVVKAMVFPVVMYGCEVDCEKSWAPKNWCFWTVVLEKTLQSPLDCKEVQPVHPKGDESWVFIGGTDAEAETPTLWPPHAKSWLIGKDPDAGKDWRWEEKGMTEDEIVGWHHRLNGHEFEQTRSWWWTGKSGVLQPMGLQRVWNDWATELNWTSLERAGLTLAMTKLHWDVTS